MRHTYQNRGTYTVTVIARNKVSSQTDQAVVVVQSLIQGKSHYIMEGGIIWWGGEDALQIKP